jgi:hypothetical protein
MFFLSIDDSLFVECYLWKRHHYGSNEYRGYYGMTFIDECTRSTYLYGFRRILSMVRRRFLEDRKSDHGITEEKQESCMDQEMCRIISKDQGFVDDIADTKSPQHGR